MSEPIRVLIADDHPIVRQGMELVLGTQPDLDLVGTAVNGEEAVQKALVSCPDVIVMDLHMPVKDGLTAIREIKQARPNIQILVLTSFTDNVQAVAAIKEGATGYLLKDSPPEELIAGIKKASQGESVLHPTIAQKLMQEIRKPPTNLPPQEQLTPREIDVLKFLGQGYSNQEIADQLTISVRTVTTHVRNILDKLQLANRTQAALYAVEQGFAKPPGGFVKN